MSDEAGVAKVDLGLDLPAHEETYAGFVHLTENITLHILNIILLLVLWGLEGHPFVALIGFILNIAATALAELQKLESLDGREKAVERAAETARA